MVNVLCGALYWERIFIPLIYLTIEAGSSVVENGLDTQRSQVRSPLTLNFSRTFKLVGNGIVMHSWKNKLTYSDPESDESMDLDLEIHSRIKDPSLKPLQPLYVDSWAYLHVNMILFKTSQ